MVQEDVKNGGRTHLPSWWTTTKWFPLDDWWKFALDPINHEFPLQLYLWSNNYFPKKVSFFPLFLTRTAAARHNLNGYWDKCWTAGNRSKEKLLARNCPLKCHPKAKTQNHLLLMWKPFWKGGFLCLRSLQWQYFGPVFILHYAFFPECLRSRNNWRNHKIPFQCPKKTCPEERGGLREFVFIECIHVKDSLETTSSCDWLPW